MRPRPGLHLAGPFGRPHDRRRVRRRSRDPLLRLGPRRSAPWSAGYPGGGRLRIRRPLPERPRHGRSSSRRRTGVCRARPGAPAGPPEPAASPEIGELLDVARAAGRAGAGHPGGNPGVSSRRPTGSIRAPCGCWADAAGRTRRQLAEDASPLRLLLGGPDLLRDRDDAADRPPPGRSPMRHRADRAGRSTCAARARRRAGAVRLRTGARPGQTGTG